MWSKRDEKQIRKSFALERDAERWRSDALTALDTGKLHAPKPTTVQQAWDAWCEGAKARTVRNRSGDTYKPSALRSYERAMRLRVLPEFSHMRVADARKPEIQDFADRLLAEGFNPSTIKCNLLPLRAVFRRAVSRGELAVNPCDGLELTAVRGRRTRTLIPPRLRR